VLDNVRLGPEALLGEQDKGFYALMKNLQTERIALAAMAIGHCQRAIELTLDYVRQRQAFGKSLWEMQHIRQRIAMLDAKTRSARQFMYHCAWSVTQEHDIVQEVSMLKALTGDLVNEVVGGCLQFWGGMGYMREAPIERLWRDARVLAIGHVPQNTDCQPGRNRLPCRCHGQAHGRAHCRCVFRCGCAGRACASL